VSAEKLDGDDESREQEQRKRKDTMKSEHPGFNGLVLEALDHASRVGVGAGGLAGAGVADRCGSAVDDLAALPIGKDGKEVLVAGTAPNVAVRVIREADSTEATGTLVHAAGNQFQNERDDSQKGGVPRG